MSCVDTFLSPSTALGMANRLIFAMRIIWRVANSLYGNFCLAQYGARNFGIRQLVARGPNAWLRNVAASSLAVGLAKLGC